MQPFRLKMSFKVGALRIGSLKYVLLACALAIAIIFAPTQATATIPQAMAAARVEQRQQQVRQVRPDNYSLSQHPVTDANEQHWRNILWTTAIVEPQEDYVAEAIAHILSFTAQTNLSRAQSRTVSMALQIGTQLYTGNPTGYLRVGEQFLQTIEHSSKPEWVAMALSAFVKAGVDPAQRQQLYERVLQRFPRWTENVYLYTTLRESALNPPPSTPPLKDLLNWAIAPNQLHLYVLCRPDRAVLCQTVLKDQNGEFVRQNGQLWTVPLLVRSLHGLSWNFTRGQSPQGIYRIEGTRAPDSTSFRAYGSFPLVKLFVPFESDVQEFLPGHRGTLAGDLTAYQSLLPPSWRSYFPVQQSYWAGKAGRGLFRIHGSGEAPTFFSNNSRHPDSGSWNPTIGCLSALELYDEMGRLQQADMPKILSALTTVGGQDFAGYLVVVEVPGGSGMLSMEEIEGILQSQV